MSEARKGLVPKTTAERVAALRRTRDALGLKRLELYAHPEDWPAIKALAKKLQRGAQRSRQVVPANKNYPELSPKG